MDTSAIGKRNQNPIIHLGGELCGYVIAEDVCPIIRVKAHFPNGVGPRKGRASDERSRWRIKVPPFLILNREMRGGLKYPNGVENRFRPEGRVQVRVATDSVENLRRGPDTHKAPRGTEGKDK